MKEVCSIYAWFKNNRNHKRDACGSGGGGMKINFFWKFICRKIWQSCKKG